MNESAQNRKLEIACGPTPRDRGLGYEYNDLHPGVGIDHIGPVQDLEFPDGTFTEIYGSGAVEHLTYFEAAQFFRRAIRWLSPGGVLYLDAPDMVNWMEDIIRKRRSKSAVLVAINGWCRWPGDEHRSFWTEELLTTALRIVGFDPIISKRQSDRDGGVNSGPGPSRSDWHICVRAYRPLGELPVIIASDAGTHGWGAE